MALIRTSHLVQTISGAVGGEIFKQTKHGLVVAHRPPPRKLLTSRQLNTRAKFQAIRAYYLSTLTEAQRLQWDYAARQLIQTNRLGIRRAPTGLQLFIQQNMQTANPASPTTTPGNLRPGVILLGLDWDCEEGGPFTLSCTAASDTGGNMQLFFARPFSDRPHHHSTRWRKPDTASAPVTPAASRNLYSRFLEAWGAPAAGEYIGLRMYRHGAQFLPSPVQELWVAVAP